MTIFLQFLLIELGSGESFFFKLEQSCFILLCQFLLYSKVNPPYVYINLFFFWFLI